MKNREHNKEGRMAGDRSNYLSLEKDSRKDGQKPASRMNDKKSAQTDSDQDAGQKSASAKLKANGTTKPSANGSAKPRTNGSTKPSANRSSKPRANGSTKSSTNGSAKHKKQSESLASKKVSSGAGGKVLAFLSPILALFSRIKSKVYSFFGLKVKPPKVKNEMRGRRRKKRMLVGTLIFFGVILVLIGSLYGYYIHRYDRDVRVRQDYADNWEDLLGDTFADRDRDSDDEPAAPSLELPVFTDGGDGADDEDGNALDNISQFNEKIIRIPPKDKNIENILLLGLDGTNLRSGNRSDTMIIVSIHRRENTIRMVSLMRDIWAYYPNRGGFDKLNAAYAYGGPAQAVNIINYNFDLDIQKYVVTDFNGLRNLVDVLGGISLRLSSGEAGEIPGVSGSGTYRLNGNQALEYARIRSIDSDFSRVQRQRNIISAMLSEFKGKGPQTQINAINSAVNYVRSNIGANELTGSMLNMVQSSRSEIKQRTVPENGMYTVRDGDIWYMSVSWDRQIDSLHKFLYRLD